MFRYIYWILALLLYVVMLPRLLYRLFSHQNSRNISAKFFLQNNPKFQKYGIWFHSCSLGETAGLKPIIDRLDGTINMSVSTNTGYEKALTMTDGDVRYLPFEIFLPFWIVKQKMLIVTESEYWYLLYLVARARGAKTLLINARISDKGYDRYKRYLWLYRRVFDQIDTIYAQSQKDRDRFETLGVRGVRVAANSKLSNIPKVTKQITKPNGRMIVAASTHIREEELVLSSWSREQGRLVIVPRRPERFDEVDAIIRDYLGDKELDYHRYSQQQSLDADIVLVDMMGELINIYAVSDVVVLGGGFFADGAGGHNPLEVAHFDNILICGQNIHGNEPLYESIESIYMVDRSALGRTLESLDGLKQSHIKESGSIEPIIEYIKANMDDDRDTSKHKIVEK